MIESSIHVDRATLETAHAAKCEVAGKVLRSFGSLRLQVTGLSMIPSVWPGDLLLIGRAHIGQIVPGDIVLFTRDGRFIAHRVVSRTGDNETTLLITRGDALPAQDSAITSAELLGKVSSIFCAGEWSEPRKRLSLSGRLIGVLVSRFGRLGAVLVHLRMMRQRSGRRKRGCVR